MHLIQCVLLFIALSSYQVEVFGRSSEKISSSNPNHDLPLVDIPTKKMPLAKKSDILSYMSKKILSAAPTATLSRQSRFPSPQNWTDEIVYSIIVDRFNNGDPTNDHLNLPSFQRDEVRRGVLDSGNIFRYRLGGDVAGVDQRMGYLKQLGITTILLSSVLKHYGDYLGDCLQDPSKVDPGFGKDTDLKHLIQHAHSIGIKVMLEFPVAPLCGNTNALHVNGMGFVFDSDNNDFRDIFTSVFKYWIVYADIDGLRMKGSQRASTAFIAYFSTHIRDFAKSLGKSNFIITGDHRSSMDTTPVRPSRGENLLQTLRSLEPIYSRHPFFQQPTLNAVDNHNLQLFLRRIGSSQTPLQFQSVYDEIISSTSNSNYESWISFDSSSHLRILKSVFDSRANSHETATSLYVAGNRAHAYMTILSATFPGTPIVFYGSEQGLTGSCPQSSSSEDIPQSLRAICSDESVNPSTLALSHQPLFKTRYQLRTIDRLTDTRASFHPSPTALHYNSTRSSTFKTIAKWNHIRHSCSALKRGRFRMHSPRGVNRQLIFASEPWFSFSRYVDDYEIIVIASTGDVGSVRLPRYSIPVMMRDAVVGDVFVDLEEPRVRAHVVSYRQGANQNLFLEFEGGEQSAMLPRRGIYVMVPLHVREDRYNVTIGAYLCKF